MNNKKSKSTPQPTNRVQQIVRGEDSWISENLSPIEACKNGMMATGMSEREAEIFIDVLSGKEKRPNIVFDIILKKLRKRPKGGSA